MHDVNAANGGPGKASLLQMLMEILAEVEKFPMNNFVASFKA
jgi:hypothetical protein